MVVPHKKLTCQLPDGAGQNLTVTVTRDGQSGGKKALTYASPNIFPQTLKVVGQPAPTIIGGVAVVTSPSTGGAVQVVFQGQYFGTDPSAAVIQGPLLSSLFRLLAHSVRVAQ
jgi:hypothetical protein